jgi:hypothetical protein
LQIKRTSRMTRRNPGLLELKHGALIVLTFILAVTAGKEDFFFVISQ